MLFLGMGIVFACSFSIGKRKIYEEKTGVVENAYLEKKHKKLRTKRKYVKFSVH